MSLLTSIQPEKIPAATGEGKISAFGCRHAEKGRNFQELMSRALSSDSHESRGRKAAPETGTGATKRAQTRSLQAANEPSQAGRMKETGVPPRSDAMNREAASISEEESGGDEDSTDTPADARSGHAGQETVLLCFAPCALAPIIPPRASGTDGVSHGPVAVQTPDASPGAGTTVQIPTGSDESGNPKQEEAIKSRPAIPTSPVPEERTNSIVAKRQPAVNTTPAKDSSMEDELSLSSGLPLREPAEFPANDDSQPPHVDVQEPCGTSTAKMETTMKSTDKTPKTAGLAEQELPGPATIAAPEEFSRRAAHEREFAPREERRIAPMAPVGVSSPTDTKPVEPLMANSTGSLSVAPLADLRARSLERTHEMVALHAMRLQDSGRDSLRVVIKPGAGTQLALELRAHAGGIEAQAQLQRGDYDLLNQHWPELQQRLETRGVRLAALSADASFSGATNHFRQPDRQPTEHEALAAGAFAEFALAGSMTEPPSHLPARKPLHRGWQTWA